MHSQELAALTADVASLKVDVADLRAETRVTKHDVANLSGKIDAAGARLEKMDDRLGAKMDVLTERLTGINLKQERGLGFFAGMAAVFTVAGGFILALGKMLFGGAP